MKLRIVAIGFCLCGCAGLRQAGQAAGAPSDALGGQTPVHVIVDGATKIASGDSSGAIPIGEALSVLIAAAAGAATGHVSGGSKGTKAAEKVVKGKSS